MDAFGRMLKVSGIVLALVIAVLASHPAAANSNTGSGQTTLRGRVSFARGLCDDLAGTFSVSVKASMATATTTCAEGTGHTSTCTHTTSSTSCTTTPPAEAPGGTGPGAWEGEVVTGDHQITPTAGIRSPRQVGTLADGQSLTVEETSDSGTAPLHGAGATPGAIEPVVTEPTLIEDTEDEEA